jgi:hypothetical protein
MQLAWLVAAMLASPADVAAIGAATLLQARERLGMRAFVTGTPTCRVDAKRCFGIVVHVVVGDDAVPVVTPAWFAEQVSEANRLFAEIDVGFEVVDVRSEPANLAKIETRSDRDHLGRGAHDPGVVHVWTVTRLADVDLEGDEIRGVHWRDRADTTRRFIILSSIAGSRTLAHELGHFFGLPHSSFAASIMNKTPRSEPPSETWGFVPSEYRTMARRRDAMTADRTLSDRDCERRHDRC